MVIGGHGGRVDHFVANLLLLASPSLAALRVEARLGDAWVVVVRDHADLHGEVGDLCSLLPLGGVAHGVVTRGLRFPLRSEDLEPGSTRGVSNVFIEPHAAGLAHRRRPPRRAPPDPKGPMMKRLAIAFVALVVALTALLAGSAPDGAAPRRETVTITLVTHDSFAVSKSVLAGFTKQTGHQGRRSCRQAMRAPREPGDPHQGPPEATCSSASTTTFLGRALDAGIFRVHAAIGLDQVPDEYKLDGPAPRHADRPR